MDGSDPTARPPKWASQLHANHLVRRPLLFVVGLLVTWVAATITQPRWEGLCANFNAEQGIPCSPMTFGIMYGYFLIGLGVFMMILGPIINSLYRLYRYGQIWETSRVETAVGNVPLIVGFVYVVLGFLIAAIGT